MLKAAWQNVKQFPSGGMTLPELHAYVDMDMSLSCHSQLTEDEICNSVRETTDSEPKCESEEESETASTSPFLCSS